MSEANDHRGEASVFLQGHEYVLRPSYAALAAIERATGLGMIKLCMLAETGDLTSEQAATVVTECIKAWLPSVGRGDEAQHWKTAKVAGLILEGDGGLFGLMRVLVPFMRAAVTGGYTATGEVKAAGTGPTGDTGSAA